MNDEWGKCEECGARITRVWESLEWIWVHAASGRIDCATGFGVAYPRG